MDSAYSWVQQSQNHFAMSSLLGGHSVWWNPFVALGTPFVQNLQPSFFYPTSFITHFFHLQSYGIDSSNLLNMVIAGLGTYLLSKQLGIPKLPAVISGTIFMLSGTFVWLLTPFTNVASLLPWMFYFTFKILLSPKPTIKEVMGLALVVFLEAIGGLPDVPFIAVVFFLLPLVISLVIFKKTTWQKLLLLIESFVIGGLLSSFLLVPFVFTLHYSSFFNATNSISFSLAPNLDQTWLFPYSFGHWFHPPLSIHQWYSFSTYFGVMATILALWGAMKALQNKNFIFLVLIILIILDIFQEAGIGIAQFISSAPIVSLLPFTRFSMILMALFIAIVAGYGLTHINYRQAIVITLLSLVIISVFVLYNKKLIPPGFATQSIAVGLGIGLIAIVVLLFIRKQQTLIVVAGTLCIIELLFLSNSNFTHLPKSHYTWKQPSYISFLKKHLNQNRIFSIVRLRPSFSSDFNIRDISFEGATMPKSYSHYIKTYLNPQMPPDAFFYLGTYSLPQISPYLELIGVKYLVYQMGEPPGGTTIPPIYTNSKNQIQISQLKHPKPIVWTPKKIINGNKVPSSSFLNNVEIPNLNYVFNSTFSISKSNFHNGSINFTAKSGSRRIIVIDNQNYPGWKATVDGKNENILPVDGLLQGIWIPKGTSNIHLSFTPRGQYKGLFLSVLAIIWIIGRYLKEKERLSKKIL